MQLIQVASKCCAHEVGCFLVVVLRHVRGELLLCIVHEVLEKPGNRLIPGKQVRKCLELVRLMTYSSRTCVQQRTQDNVLIFQ